MKVKVEIMEVQEEIVWTT